MRSLEITHDAWPITGGFRIARGAKSMAETLTVTLAGDGHAGRGECVPYGRYGESLASVRAQIESLRPAIEGGLSREDLQYALPAGAARNALDCALWDLQAKSSGMPVWRRAGLNPPKPVCTALTIALDTPSNMAAKARAAQGFCVLKLKLAGDGADLVRLRAITAARPDVSLILDANEALDRTALEALLAELAALNVALVEQPVPASEDAALSGLETPVPLCADESAHTAADLARLEGLYGAVNIKLDKTGGLTQALVMARAAKARGLRIMLGCMVCTSLGIAPMLLLGDMADVIDLDGPLLLQRDRENGLVHDGARLAPPQPALWG